MLYINRAAEYFFDFNDEERKTQLEITKEIRAAGGVINYLRLDEAGIAGLENRLGGNNTNGVGAFISLLRDTHFSLSNPNATAADSVRTAREKVRA